jgi:hypothetical protein
MILKLEKAGLISRQPGVPRSIVVLLHRSALPMLAPSGVQPVKTTVQRYYSIPQVSWDRHSRSVGRRRRHPER